MKNLWLRIREYAATLKPCRLPILFVLGGLAFLASSQGEDVARALAERRSGDAHAIWQARWFFAATLAWSLSAWYWARATLFLRLPGVPGLGDEHVRRLREWTPRLLGFIAALGVAVAFYRAATGYAPNEQEDVQALLRSYGLWCIVGAFAFLFTAAARRPAARYAYGKLKEGSRLQTALAPVLDLPHHEEEHYGELSFLELAPLTRWLLGIAVASVAALFIVFTAAPLSVAPAIGSAGIVLLAAAGWITLGTIVDVIGMQARFPAFTALFILALAFSPLNDNHAVRTLDAAQPKERLDVRAQLKAWLDTREAELKDPKARVPMYFVDAEGGGIRAAYWTVTVLGEIQNRHPAFAAHLFSLSGVSGGSLGAAVFVALVAQSREDPALDVKKRAQAILGEDFLSPVVASMLYPDLVQRVLPFPIAAFDRAKTLEQSWERAWDLHVAGRARMSEPLDALWQDRSQWTPALILNATWVETGKRLIASNIDVAAAKSSEDFIDVEDANAFFAPRSLSLATAAHMSARFTYVSPAGSLVRDGRVYGRVVDGGYFENSGATATREILETIELLKDEDARWKRVDAYVIHISNDPVDERYADDSLAGAPANPRIAPKTWLNELLSPLRALLNTRDARGFYARESVMWQAGWSNSFHFGLCRKSSNVPLGWVLSQATRERMEAQLTQIKCGDVFDNPGNLKAIDRQFAAPAGPV